MTEPAPKWRASHDLCAIVVGAASGAGERFARAFAANNIALLLVDRDELALVRLRNELNAHSVHCDILDERCVGDMFDAAEQLLGHVDLLVNAAGSGYVRTLGVMRATREFARRPRVGRAYVINVAATPGATAGPFEYAGSEAAFTRLTDGLARAIENPDLRVITLERVEAADAVADLTDQLLRQFGIESPSRSLDGGQAEAS